MNYTTGTITLANGSNIVTGTGTGWQTAVIAGGVIYPQAAGNPLPIASVDSNTKITAATAWVGASGTYAYAIQRQDDKNQTYANAAALADYIRRLDNETLAALAGLTPAPDRIPYFDGNSAAALTTLTAFARSLLAGANAAAIVDALGLDGTFQPIASRGALSGFRNKLINPTFAIAQRGEIFTIPAGTAVYTADRWRIVNNTNRELTVQCPAPFSAGATGNKGRLRLNFFTPPTSGDVYVTQRIEDASTLAGKRATMGFTAIGGAGITAAIVLVQIFGSGGSAAVDTGYQPVALTAAAKNVRFVADLPSTVGKTFGAGSYLNYQIKIPFRDTSVVSLTDMFLVEGDARTEDNPVAERHIAQELALCRRYYWRGEVLDDQALRYSSAGSALLAGQISFGAEMAYTPSTSIVTPPIYQNCSGMAIIAEKYGLYLRVTVPTAGTFRAYNGVYEAEAEIW